ncbi:VWA domain-containing protein [Winogradskya humida]|uniref:VWA domain-containing protein n=1 Tax=Winogradskya humida TaxID=113566 RepID=UPI001941EE0E|nr:VWA domain-containing protein [Actinoplanes humidus]
MTDPELERWRLVLGEPASAMGALGADGAARDAALEWLYGRDGDHEQRDVRRGSGGGDGASTLTTVDWLNDINRLFPQETIERLQRDAVERYEINDIVTDAAVLETIEPNPALLRAVLQTKHLMNPEVLRLARRIVEAVVRDLMAKMATEVRAAFTGTRARRPSRWKQARDFDMRRTLRANLGHYRPEERRVFIETPHFFSRTRKHVEQWQVILLVDQSGSMVESVIHSAVTAACLWGLPGVRTHLVAFDTDVVDLTSEVDDPVELLMKVQLGGGTDIARAVRYGAGLVEQPRRAIVVLISDFYEGGSTSTLVRTVRELVEQGTKVLGLAALDEQANPVYDRDTAQRLADVGASMGAMTPGQLAAFVAEQVAR